MTCRWCKDKDPRVTYVLKNVDNTLENSIIQAIVEDPSVVCSASFPGRVGHCFLVRWHEDFWCVTETVGHRFRCLYPDDSRRCTA